MPSDALPVRIGSSSVLQSPPSSTTGSSPATMSNQYQPPSPKLRIGRSKTLSVMPLRSLVATRCCTPCAFER